MGIDIEAFKKSLEEDLANPNGYWNTLMKAAEAKKTRYPKIEAYINSCDFPALIGRLAREHEKEWADKCYARGCEPYPNNKFSMLWDYIKNNYTHVENPQIPQDFLSSSYFVKGYWFTVYSGQGCFYRVYDRELNFIFQI